MQSKGSNPYYEKGSGVVQTKGNLPHWSQNAKLYFVTFRLKDSMPSYVVERFREYCTWREQVIKLKGYMPEELAEYEVEKHNRMMKYLDAGHGECILKEPSVRNILVMCIRQMETYECHVHAYVIMPNHVHLILETNDESKVSYLLGKVKSISAHLINKHMGRRGVVWQHEVYDRLIRNGQHYWYAVRYIARNPLRCPSGAFTLFLSEEHEKYLNNSRG